jgi:hypothetical protein
MPDPSAPKPNVPANDLDRLHSLLSQWEVGFREGAEPSPEELCPDDPALCERLRRRIAAELEFVQHLRPSPGPTLTGPGATSHTLTLPQGPAARLATPHRRAQPEVSRRGEDAGNGPATGRPGVDRPGEHRRTAGEPDEHQCRGVAEAHGPTARGLRLLASLNARYRVMLLALTSSVAWRHPVCPAAAQMSPSFCAGAGPPLSPRRPS